MSMVNVVVYQDRVAFFHDTKSTDENGLQYHTSKVAIIPHARLIIAVRGYIGALRVFERLIGLNCSSYEGAISFVADHFARIRAGEYADASEAFAMKQDVDLYVGGFSRSGPAAFWVSNYQTNGQVRRIDGWHISPSVDAETYDEFAANWRTGMPALCAKQAAQHVAVGGWLTVTEMAAPGAQTYPLGGLCELSSVTSRSQPDSEVEELAAIVAANSDRAARLAAITDVG